MIPQEFIQQLKETTDIVDVIGELLPPGSELKRSGQGYKALCPFHYEKTPSFVVSPKKERWHCFGACNTGGDVIDFILRIRPSMTFRDAVIYLANKANLEIPDDAKPSPDDAKRKHLYRITHIAMMAFHNSLFKSPKASMAKAYVMGERALSIDTVEKFKIGWAPKSTHDLSNALLNRGFDIDDIVDAGVAVHTDGNGLADRFRDRIMFPIRDKHGNVTGFGGRIYRGGSPKYINSPAGFLFNKSESLYGLYEVDASQAARHGVYVVEGYFDVIALHEIGVGNVLGIMGTSLTEQQAKKITRVSNNIFLVLDGDSAGVSAAIKAIKVFNTIPDARVSIIAIPVGKDPYSIIFEDGENEWKKLASSSQTGIEFVAKHLGVNISNPEDAAGAMDTMLPLLVTKRASVLDQYVTIVAKYLKLSPDTIKRELADFKAPLHRRQKDATVNPKPITTSQYIIALIDMFPSVSPFELGLNINDFSDSMDRAAFIALTSWGAEDGSDEAEYIKRIRSVLEEVNIKIDDSDAEAELRRAIIKHKKEQVSILTDMLTEKGLGSKEEIAEASEKILRLKQEIISIEEGRVNEAPF